MLNGAWNSFFVNVGDKTSFSLSLKFPLIIVSTAIIIYIKRVIYIMDQIF
jgi:hypothetical protein